MMPTEITVVQTTELHALFDLLQQSGLPLDGLHDHLATTLVAREDGQVLGSVALELYGDAALLRSVAVVAERRGSGLGQCLTQEALAFARSQGVRTLYLLTETAASFFSRFGFRPVARDAVLPTVQRSVEFTTACPASALVMVLDLG